ncbi:hypothetical protein D0B54_07815 [Solimonas sp. K1W22B-7]|uniref:hypothetical protein n=1 Tax=Solimonas sp. K1W22B-7 TaxID=2303331 RepID=UPI000E337478|nr:hypothetical protein [Solimonas sp. K1W22B-7]AXQ28592.1 hypothetical protein D0B54_07815 [Solimonas sp. K1W22B-7]
MNRVSRIALLSSHVLLACAALPVAAAPAIGTDNVSAIKGHRKVVIAEFGVEFYTQLHSEGRAGGSNAQVTTTLTGVSDATFQAVTEQAYKDTVAALTQAGFEVMDPQVLKASPLYQELATKYGTASPQTFVDEKLVEGAPSISKIFAPAGMPAFFSSSAIRGDFGQRTDSQNQGRGKKEGDLAKSLDVTLLHVHYLASFGLVSGTKNGVLAGIAGVARAAIEPQPVLFPEETEIQFVTDAGFRTFTNSHRPRHSGAVYLKAPLSAGSGIFELKDTTSTESKKGDAITNAFGSLVGGFGQKRKSSEAVPQSEAAYGEAIQKLIGESANGLTQALAGAL